MINWIPEWCNLADKASDIAALLVTTLTVTLMGMIPCPDKPEFQCPVYDYYLVEEWVSVAPPDYEFAAGVEPPIGSLLMVRVDKARDWANNVGTAPVDEACGPSWGN